MSFENKPGTGAFFPNNKKSENHPDFKGPYYEKVGDKLVEREIAVWKRRSVKSGQEYYSFKIGDKFQPQKKTFASESSEKPEPPTHDDIPW